MSQLNERAFFEYLLDQSNDAVQVTDESGQLLYVNLRACQLSGLSRQELLNKHIEVLDAAFHDTQIWERHVTEVQEKGQILRESELLRPDGTSFPVESSVRHFRMNGQGYIISVIRDISVRKRQQLLFKKILDELPLSISLQSLDDTYNFENRYSTRHGLGSDTLAELDSSYLDSLYAKGSVIREEKLTNDSGEVRWFETTQKAFYDEAFAQGVLTIKVDITQRKQDAEELLKAKKAKEQFLANMSHEIRTPINGISGMLNLLHDTHLSAEQKKYIESITEASRNLRAIINDILDISAIESGKLSLERINFRPDYQIQSAINSFRLQAHEKGLTLRHQLDADAQTIVIGDPLRLSQILLNLIGNAIKFTHQGEIVVTARRIPKSNTEVWMEYSVGDTGIGISPEKLSIIFDSFQQAEESTSRQYGGTGLGLAICKQLAELQQGTLEVESKLNVGTTFRFTLPYPLGNETDFHQGQTLFRKTHLQKDYSALANLRILLVEDNDINSIYAKNTLKKVSCWVDHAENGLIALEKIRKNAYDLILMDVQMPVMDGFETTQTLRTNFEPPKSEIPVIALTANAIKGDSERCLAIGMNHYISKPFEPEHLYQIMMQFVPEAKPNTSTNTPPTPMNHKNEHSGNTSVKSIIDLSYLTSICDGDSQFMNEIISSFITDIPIILKQLEQQIVTASWLEASKVAHQMKPSMQFMGLQETLRKVKSVEQYCKQENNLTEVHELLTEIKADIQQAVKELKDISAV